MANLAAHADSQAQRSLDSVPTQELVQRQERLRAVVAEGRAEAVQTYMREMRTSSAEAERVVTALQMQVQNAARVSAADVAHDDDTSATVVAGKVSGQLRSTFTHFQCLETFKQMLEQEGCELWRTSMELTQRRQRTPQPPLPTTTHSQGAAHSAAGAPCAGAPGQLVMLTPGSLRGWAAGVLQLASEAVDRAEGRAAPPAPRGETRKVRLFALFQRVKFAAVEGALAHVIRRRRDGALVLRLLPQVLGRVRGAVDATAPQTLARAASESSEESFVAEFCGDLFDSEDEFEDEGGVLPPPPPPSAPQPHTGNAGAAAGGEQLAQALSRVDVAMLERRHVTMPVSCLRVVLPAQLAGPAVATDGLPPAELAEEQMQEAEDDPDIASASTEELLLVLAGQAQQVD